MKKNFIKILACTLAMSTMCSGNLINISAEENMSEELRNYILNYTSKSVFINSINENCIAMPIYFVGLDENGKEIYQFAPYNEEFDDYYVPDVLVEIGYDENGKDIFGAYYDRLVWFDDEGNPKLIDKIKLGKTEDEGIIYKTNNIITGEDMIVIRYSFKDNVVVKNGDSSLDGTVDVRDVTAINQHIIKANILPDYADTVADVNDDGNIDISDLGLLKQYIIKMIDSF